MTPSCDFPTICFARKRRPFECMAKVQGAKKAIVISGWMRAGVKRNPLAIFNNLINRQALRNERLPFFCHFFYQNDLSTDIQGGASSAICPYVGQSGRCVPGRYPMLMRNSPVISPPVKRNVFLNNTTQSAFCSG
jgi:hypothetical protein